MLVNAIGVADIDTMVSISSKKFCKICDLQVSGQGRVAEYIALNRRVARSVKTPGQLHADQESKSKEGVHG
jgi:hypothetical protein